MTAADIGKHSARAAEAWRRIVLAAALDELAPTRSDRDAAAILAGARACLWLTAGTSREASECLFEDLTSEYGADVVLAASVAMCVECPPGPAVWLKQACKQREVVRIHDGAGKVADYEFHPLAGLFPMIEGQPYLDLMADVLKNGVREPVWLYEGKILDGRNRWRAAKATGVKVETREYTGDDATGFVISLNLHRRHLSESQRAAVAAKLAILPVGSNQHAQICAPTQGDAAEMLNVSRRSVQAAAKVQQSGVPELSAALDAGTVSVSAAAAVATLPAEQQQEVVAAGPQAVREVAKAVRNGKTYRQAASKIGMPDDNAAFRALFTLPPIRQSASTELMIPEIPPQTVVTGDNEVDAVIWLQNVVGTGNQSLIDKAMEAVKRIKTPMKELADRYAAHIMRNGGHTMQAVFATVGFGELEGLAKGAIEKAARRHEALSRFGTMEALFGDTPAQAACKKALDGMEPLQSPHYRFDSDQAAERFAACAELAPATLADCIHEQAYWRDLDRLRYAVGGIGDADTAGQAHDDYCFAALAHIPPRTTAEALEVLAYLEAADRMDAREAGAILRNLIRGPVRTG